MEKVLKLKLFQETACYKKPFAFKVAETYPLPPYATVKGMIHYILKAEEFIPMSISVQGDYESKFENYQSMYFYKDKEITKMPLNIHLLYNVNLIIHIKAEEKVLNDIVEGIKNLDEHLSLGRKEDIARLDEVRFVSVKTYDPEEVDEAFKIKHPIYIPQDNLPSDVSGVSYRLNWKYNLVQGIRQWERINVKYIDEGKEITEKILLDDDLDDTGYGDLVCFNTTQ
jgi:CRISPR-associated protein Cas5t